MPLRILFADDSATAQSMGVKILTEAGYEVVAVSNGAAALKKIAEQKPDIAILDVYMPGYNGLEVCEKMRSSIATLNTPVLLTRGKMEAYRNEDTNRVKADGIIVKPFEASDLLAIVKQLEDRIFQPAPLHHAPAEETLYLERPTLMTDEFQREHFSGDTAKIDSPKIDVAQETETLTKRYSELEIPDHMAGSPVYSDTPTNEFYEQPAAVPAPETALEQHSAAEVSIPISEPAPLTAWQPAPPAEAAPTVVPTTVDIPSPEPSSWEVSPRETQIMPVYRPETSNESGAVTHSAPEEVAVSPRPESQAADAVQAATPSVSESAASALPVVFLQENAVRDGRDPALVTDRTEMTSFATKFGVDNAEEIPVGVYSESWTEAPAAEIERFHPVDPPAAEAAVAEVSTEDFEARVAAAMTAYDSEAQSVAQPEPRLETQPEIQPGPSSVHVPVEAQAPGVEIAHQDVSATPAPESEISAAPAEMSGAEPPVAEGAVAKSEQTYGHAVSTYPATDVPVAVPVAAAGMAADAEVIAQVVNRVLERLKPDLIAEILRELNANR